MKIVIEESQIWINGNLYIASDFREIILKPDNMSVSFHMKEDGLPFTSSAIDEDQMDTIIQDLREFAERNGIETEEE